MCELHLNVLNGTDAQDVRLIFLFLNILMQASYLPVCWGFETCLHWETWTGAARENRHLLADSFPQSCSGRCLGRAGACVPWSGLALCLLIDVCQIDGLCWTKARLQENSILNLYSAPSTC